MSASTSAELLGRPVQLHGSALATALLRAAGWRVRFDGLPSRQGVVIVYPHTSNWDFVVGLLAKWSMGIPVAFWGKASLFALPVFGRWMRWVGGLPVDRSSPRGAVGEMAQRFEQAKTNDQFFWLALAPEGTRGWRPHWRSGFYRVALQAGVPLGMAYIDYTERVVGVDRFLSLCGDAAVDMAAVEAHLGHRHGRRPELAAPVRLPPREEEPTP